MRIDLNEAEAALADNGIDGPDQPYNPRALRAMRVADALLAEVKELRGKALTRSRRRHIVNAVLLGLSAGVVTAGLSWTQHLPHIWPGAIVATFSAGGLRYLLPLRGER